MHDTGTAVFGRGFVVLRGDTAARVLPLMTVVCGNATKCDNVYGDVLPIARPRQFIIIPRVHDTLTADHFLSWLESC